MEESDEGIEDQKQTIDRHAFVADTQAQPQAHRPIHNSVVWVGVGDWGCVVCAHWMAARMTSCSCGTQIGR